MKQLGASVPSIPTSLSPSAASGDLADTQYVDNAVKAGIAAAFATATDSAAGTTTSTSYTSTLTGGSSVARTVTTGTSVLVIIGCNMSHSALGGTTLMSVAVSGATTLASSDNNALAFKGNPSAASQQLQASSAFVITGLTAGSNTFTTQFKIITAGTGTYQRRQLTVIPL